jgi:hypothetical protein
MNRSTMNLNKDNNPANDPLLKAMKIEPQISLFLPSETSVFNLSAPVTEEKETVPGGDKEQKDRSPQAQQATAPIDKNRILYDESFLHDTNSLSEEQILRLADQYR